MRWLLALVALVGCSLVGPDALGGGKRMDCYAAHPYAAIPCYTQAKPLWLAEYSPGVVLIGPDNESVAFDVPVRQGRKAGQIDMLTKHWAGAASGTLTVTVRVDTTGTPLWRSADPGPCANPIAARIYLATDDWSDTTLPDHELRRWWSHTGYLALGGAGTFTFSASLAPSTEWGNVNGHPANESSYYTAGFEMVKLQGGRIGLVFGGGGCSYGHGVFVTGGTVRFTVLSYEVQ